ncbi:MAG TPA: response regulator [Azospirillaceae bacterium]|nr:response regulator [Azospirillaceae bacterium]HRQ81066.1 response regulator [Azospirillaceae bacterium]
MEKSSLANTSGVVSPPDDAPAAPAGGRRGRLAGIDAPARSYDVDTLLVELGPVDGDEPPPVDICRKVEDLFTFHARFAIQEALGDFLESEGAVATEILHRADLQQRFIAWPQREAAMDRIASSQASPGRWTAAMRGDELRALEAEVLSLTREAGHRGAPPGVNARRLSQHITQTAAATTPFRARFAVDSAVCAWLSTAAGYGEKLMLLLALDSSDLTAEAAAIADQIIGEIISARQGREAALAGVEGLGAQLRTLAELWRGDMPSDPGASSALRRLCSFSMRLTQGGLRAGVEKAIHALLAGERRFHAPANSFEARKISSVIDEFKAAAEAERDLFARGEIIGGERTAFLIDHRLGDLVAGEKLENLLRGKSHQARIFDLLTLEGAASGEYCRAMLIDAIAQHFGVRDFVQRIFEMTRAAGARLKVLADLHKALAASNVPEPLKSSNLRMLDEVQYTFMRTNRVLTRIQGEAAAAVDDVREFMGLLADGTFIEGKSAGAVRSFLERHLRNPLFVRAFVCEEMRPGEKRADRFNAFFTKAKAAGLAVRPPSGVRVLIADDEPQAREYVAMVLGDLGVQQVEQTADGRAALAAFSNSPDAYDLIICDWRMPHLSGLEVLKFVRASRPLQPFLMVTALSTLVAVEEAMAHDVTAYVAKPFTPEQLEAKVIVLLNRPPADKAGSPT